ncbi:hypothetical protein GF323_00435 [Candidatus Woesearchaeota archaeon]|nr:hypothetical protein [Candidatus Woesearchaeota archaeon]
MYVFGIDMPIMELMFIFLMLFFVALLIILLEIRKLRKLILTEQSDIYRFEEDIENMKPKDIKKHAISLTDFIRAALGKGTTKKEIYYILKKKGWPKKMIDEEFKKIK